MDLDLDFGLDFDSILIRFRFDLDFDLDFDLISIRFWLDLVRFRFGFGWIRVDFCGIWLDLGWIRLDFCSIRALGALTAL